MKISILIAEDDENTFRLLIRYFAKEGFETLSASNGKDALSIARKKHPCFIVLDLMMPDVDGWEVCEELRTTSNVPILILSARQEEADRILGLNLGADDYVVKPFSPREVVARVHAILRRSEKKDESTFVIAGGGALCLNASSCCVELSGKQVNLTTSEFILLKALMEQTGRVFTRNELLDKLCTENQTVVDRVIDVHIASIRQKFNAISDQRKYITTVRGVGYRVEA